MKTNLYCVVLRRSRSGDYEYLRFYNDGGENITRSMERPGAKWIENNGTLRIHHKMDKGLLFQQPVTTLD